MRAIFSLAVLLFASAAQAATVDAVNGNIVLDGKPITHGGRDFDPVLSPDGKRVVFLRLTGGKPLEDCAAEATTTKAQELWSVAADGSGALRLLGLKGNSDVEKTLCAFDSMQFSSDGRLLYFETPAWATSGAIHVYDFKTGKERYFLPGNGLQVLNRCRDARYRDALIVAQHRYFVFEGSFDWLWLFSPAGKQIGPVGESDTGLEDACG